MDVAKSINDTRDDMRSSTKCVALYLDGRKIVSVGINKTKTHPLLLKFQYNTYKYYSEGNINDRNNKRHRPQYPIHAELDGYIKLLNNGADFDTLFLYRGDNCNMASEPCHVCANWLKRLDNLVVGYINVDGEFTYKDSNDLIGHHRTLYRLYKNFQVD